jgi:hypothetical protein
MTTRIMMRTRNVKSSLESTDLGALRFRKDAL